MPKVTVDPFSKGLIQETGNGFVLKVLELDIGASATTVPHHSPVIIGDQSATNGNNATFSTATTPTAGTMVTVINTNSTAGSLQSIALAQNKPVVFIYTGSAWVANLSA